MGKTGGTERSELQRACVMGLLGTAATALLLLLYAIYQGKTETQQGSGMIVGRGILLFCSLISARLSIGKQPGRRTVMAGISGAVIFAFLLLLALISRNSSVINISMLLNLLCIISGGFIACLLPSGRKRKKRGGKR